MTVDTRKSGPGKKTRSGSPGYTKWPPTKGAASAAPGNDPRPSITGGPVATGGRAPGYTKGGAKS